MVGSAHTKPFDARDGAQRDLLLIPVLLFFPRKRSVPKYVPHVLIKFA
jgi:hypothetical protein